MNWLLLDSGNSRLKWALSRGDAAPEAAFVVEGWIAQPQLARRLPALLRALEELDEPVRIVACNVAAAAVERLIRRSARAARLPSPQWVRSERAAGGVRNGYREVWRLGVDRWVAMIGARSLLPRRALCVVSVGTALTIDVLRADGRHLGGAIAAGPALMVQSLLSGTAGIRRRATGQSAVTASTTLFARRTDAALLAGARYAAAALIDRAVKEARDQLGQPLKLLIGGGAAAEVLPLLQTRAQSCEDLVLRGLRVLAHGTR